MLLLLPLALALEVDVEGVLPLLSPGPYMPPEDCDDDDDGVDDGSMGSS